MSSKRIGLMAGALTLGALLGCLGGSGDTDGGSAKDTGDRNEVFVGGDATTGSLKLELNQSNLTVGGTTGFQVRVQNASGQPVPNIYVVCDSEDGVAIVEPSSGQELTDVNGVMSGRIGCERPGSFQLLCRLTIGANRRQFAAVRCSGDGFQDFPDSGGGGLGGGVQENEDGGAQVTSVTLVEASSSSENGNQVDVVQGSDCDGDATTSDPEPFFDTYATMKVQNNFSEVVTFSHVSFTVNNVDGNGTNYASPRAGVTAVTAGDGDEATISIPIFKGYGGRKYVGSPVGSGTRIEQVGFRTVTLKLFGQTASGKDVELTALVTASFGNFNGCESSS